MNVFSTLEKSDVPYLLTEAKYHERTSRKAPYVREEGDRIRSYAICPACRNPTILVNRGVSETDAKILYAKHAGYSVEGLADHKQDAYEECPFHNPERFDSKMRRTNGHFNDEIRNALLNHIHLVITTIERSAGIKYSDKVIETMLRHFGKNRGHEYRAISLYNLPFGFAYMTEGQDFWGCQILDTKGRAAINEKSAGFKTTPYGTITRKDDVIGTNLLAYFSNHRLGDAAVGEDSIELFIVEQHSTSLKKKLIYKKKLTFDSENFFNTYKRRERLRLLALQYL